MAQSNRPFIAALPMVSVVALLTLGLPGCANGPGGMFSSYTISADDACANQRQAMKSFQDYFFASMVQGAAIGGVAGGLAGYAIGGNATGALVGAGTGAVLGGMGGYYSAKQKANGDPSALTLSVYDDVNHENSQIDAVSAAFLQLRDCRLRSASAVKADFARKTVSREEAQTRLLKIKQLFLEDVTYAEGLGSKMASRAGEYDNASAQIMQSNPSAQQTLAQRNAAGGGGGGGGGPSLVANEAARVRAEPSTTGAQVASLSPGESVASLGDAPADWAHIRLRDGKTGYVASRLLRPAGTRAPSSASAPPPKDAAGVAELTESNQLKRKSLNDEVAQAKSDANGSSFELSGSISRAPAQGSGAAG